MTIYEVIKNQDTMIKNFPIWTNNINLAGKFSKEYAHTLIWHLEQRTNPFSSSPIELVAVKVEEN